MVYSGDPSASDADAVRFLIGDTSTSAPTFADAEVTYALTLEGSVLRAAAQLAEILAADDTLIDKSIGDLSISRAQQADKLAKLAKRLRMRATLGAAIYAGGVSLDDKETYLEDSDVNQPTFWRGQFDHPDTRQDGAGYTSLSTGTT
jgi:hypothetical protein